YGASPRPAGLRSCGRRAAATEAASGTSGLEVKAKVELVLATVGAHDVLELDVEALRTPRGGPGIEPHDGDARFPPVEGLAHVVDGEPCGGWSVSGERQAVQVAAVCRPHHALARHRRQQQEYGLPHRGVAGDHLDPAARVEPQAHLVG